MCVDGGNQEKGTQKTCVYEEMDMKSDSFTVDMEKFSHSKDASLNSRINLQRNLSRKGSQKGAEKKMNPSNDSERDNGIMATSSPRASLVRGTMLQKPMVVTVGTAAEQGINQHIHHQITIMTDHASPTTTPTAAAATAPKSRLIGKRLNSFKRSSVVDPRRILFLFATLSSIGTILLIYFTLTMTKLKADDNTILQ